MNRETLLWGIRSAISGEMDDLTNGIEEAANSVLNYLEKQPGLLNLSEKPKVQEIKVYFDGNGNATNGKPGLAQYRIYWPDGGIKPGMVEYQGKTNNFLEHKGLKACLDALIEEDSEYSSADVVIMGDSALVVNQVNGDWRVKEQSLIPLRDENVQLLAEARKLFKSVTLKWIPSKENLVDSHA